MHPGTKNITAQHDCLSWCRVPATVCNASAIPIVEWEGLLRFVSIPVQTQQTRMPHDELPCIKPTYAMILCLRGVRKGGPATIKVKLTPNHPT